MNRSAWATHYRRLGRDTAFLLLSGSLSLLAFCLVLPLTVAGIGTVIIGAGLPLLVLALNITGSLANLARLGVARLDEREPRPGGYLSPVPEASARRRLLRHLHDPQRWVDLLWVIVYFPVSLITQILTVAWLVLTVGGFLAPIADVITESILGDQRQGLPDLLGPYPPLLQDIVIDLACGIIFSPVAPLVLRGLAAMRTGLIRSILFWRNEISRPQTSRAAVQQAKADTHHRLEHDTHDGPQQRLVRPRMDLARAQRQAKEDPVAASAVIQDATDQTQQILDELRQLSRGIIPPVLIDHGLTAAVIKVTTRSTVLVTVSTELSQDLPDHTSQTTYFMVNESLVNLNKHSGAMVAGIEARVVGGSLQVRISDNGISRASTAKGHGPAGLIEHLSGIDGRLMPTSPAGGPTTVEAMIPCVF